MNRDHFVFTIFVLGLLGGATDVLGTYIAQPELHSEGNPLALLLAYLPAFLRWPVICVAKLAWVSFCALCLRRCVSFYASSHVTNQAPLLQVIRSYGRVGVGGVVRRYIVMTLGFSACFWLASTYAGVENLAYYRGWWKPLGFTFQGLWIPYGVFAAGFLGIAASAWLFRAKFRLRAALRHN